MQVNGAIWSPDYPGSISASCDSGQLVLQYDFVAETDFLLPQGYGNDYFRVEISDGDNNIFASGNRTLATGTHQPYNMGIFLFQSPTSRPFTIRIYDLNSFGGPKIALRSTIVLDPADAPASHTPHNCVSLPISGNTIDATEQVLSSFMLNRANHILANQPRIIGFVDGSNVSAGGALGNLSLNGNEDSMEVAFATSVSKVKANAAGKRIAQAFGKTDGEQTALSNYDQPSHAGTWDIWTEVHGARSSAGTSDSDFWVGYVGIHKFLSENMLIGLLGQFDWADETNSSAGSNAEGQGWMIGPYLAGQLPGQNLFYEARASWGRSNNSVSPIGTYRDDFDTTRWLVSAKVNGSYDLGDVTMRPELALSNFEETQESYTDSLAAVIAEQTISLGELRFGPTFTRTIETANGGTLQPMIGVSGVWNFGIRGNAASQAFTWAMTMYAPDWTRASPPATPTVGL